MKMRKLTLLALLVATLSLAVARFFITRSTTENRAYVIGWAVSPPDQVPTKSGEPTGFAVELVREAARRRGIRLKWVEHPEHAEAALRSGAVDLWSMMTITDDRKKFLHLTEPYQEDEFSLYVDDKSAFVSASDLKGQTISYDGSPLDGRLLLEHFPESTHLAKSSLAEAVQSVCDGEAQAFFEDHLTVFSLLLKNPPCTGTSFRLIPIHSIKTGLAIGATRESSAAADAIRDEISVMARDGSLERIVSAWSPAASQEVASVTRLQAAKSRLHWYRVGLASVAGLFLFALWSASGYRRQRIKAEAYGQALGSAERNVRLVADSLNEMVVAYDTDRNLIYVNSGAKKLTGYAAAELQALVPLSWTHPEDRAQVLALWDKVFDGQAVDQVVHRLIAKDGTVKWVAGTWGPVTDEVGSQVGIRGSCQDITERVIAEQLLEQTTQKFRTIAEEMAERKRAEQALRESEERFRAIFSQAAVGIAQTGTNGQWLLLNDRFCEFLGYSQGELSGKTFLEVTHPDDREASRSAIRQLLAGQISAWSTEKRYIRKDGVTVWAKLFVSLVRDQHNQPQYFISVVEDITEKVQAKLALQDTQRRLALAQSAARLGVWDRDLDTDVIAISEGYAGLYGLPPQSSEITYPQWLSMIHSDDRERVQAHIQESIQRSDVWEAEFRVVWPDGTIRWLLGKGTVFFDDSGQPIRRVGVNLDITDLKQAEAALRESEQRFRAIFFQAAVGIAQTSLDGRWLLVNDRLSEILGYSYSELSGRTFLDITHPDDREANLKARGQLLAGEISSWSTEKRYIRKDGVTVWARVFVSIVRDQNQPQYFISAIEDITERIQAERSLRDTQQRLTLAQSAAQLGVWNRDLETQVVTFSQEYARLYGLPPEQTTLTHEEWLRLIHPEDRERLQALVHETLGRTKFFSAEYRVIWPDGSVHWLLGKGTVFVDDSGRPTCATGVAMDITERKRAEAALRESEERFRNMADTAPVMIWLLGPDKCMTFVNKAWLDFTGRRLEHELGDGWLEGVHPDDRNQSSASFSSAFNARQDFHTEGRLLRADGEYRWVLCTGVPRFDANGAFAGYIGSTIDVTDQKYSEAERRRSLDEIAHLNRVAAMGELTASMAHELNQPLAAILSNAQAATRFLEARPPDLEQISECLADIVMDDKRAGEVIKRIRTLLKKDEFQVSTVDLNEVVGDVIRLIRTDALLRGVSVVFEPAAGLPPVLGDRTQLYQVVLNLTVNGLEAAGEQPSDARWLVVRTAAESDGGVLLTVHDSGKGIAEKELARVFEPFFTTKQEGLGMGLSISRSIVQAHGGSIWAETSTDGAMFRCVLPAAQETAAAARG